MVANILMVLGIALMLLGIVNFIIETQFTDKGDDE